MVDRAQKTLLCSCRFASPCVFLQVVVFNIQSGDPILCSVLSIWTNKYPDQAREEEGDSNCSSEFGVFFFLFGLSDRMVRLKFWDGQETDSSKSHPCLISFKTKLLAHITAAYCSSKKRRILHWKKNSGFLRWTVHLL